MKKDIKIIFVLFIIGFFYLLPSYNKYWAPYDEGLYLATSSMAMEGLVPYKDFFILVYPPGQAYLLGMLLRIFGMNLLVGRIYNIVLLSAICTMVFYITRSITSSRPAILSFIICLVTLSHFGEPPIPRAIWPGVLMSLLAVRNILYFIKYERVKYIFIASLFLGIITVFRHDIAILTYISGVTGFVLYFIYNIKEKDGFPLLKNIIGLSLMLAVFPVLFIYAMAIWLGRMEALYDCFRSLFVFPSTFHKWAAIPFPEFCFDFKMIFHRGCLFIRRNKFYIPIITLFISGAVILWEIIRRKTMDKKIISFIVIWFLGLVYLQQMIFRTDGNHLSISFVPTTILIGIIFNSGLNYRINISNLIKNIVVIYILLLTVLFMYRATELYIKNIIVKPYIKRTTKPVRFERGTVYIPDDVRDTFVSLVRYVRENTEEGERIYIGPLYHKVGQIGWFDLIYFLTDRMPAVKYYISIPGLQDRSDIQLEMITSLKRNNTKLLLLREFGTAEFLGPLDRFIRKNYRLKKIIDTYHIYVKE